MRSALTGDTPDSTGISDLPMGVGNDSPDGRGVFDSKSILHGGDLIDVDPKGPSLLKQTAAVEEAETGILDELEDRHGIIYDDDDRDARGRFKEQQEAKGRRKQEDKGSDDEEPALHDDADETGDEVEAMSTEQRDEYRKAVHALLRAQMDMDDIEGLSPEQILSMGGKAARKQADSQAQWQADQRKGEAQGGRVAEADGSAEPAAQPARTIPPSKVFEPLADLIGVEEANALSAAQDAQLAPLQEALGRQAEMLNQVLLRSVRSDLAEEYPDVVKGRGWQEVMAEMKVLSDTGYSTDPYLIGETACKIVRASQGPSVTSSENRDRRRRGGVRTVSRKGESQRKPKLSKDERTEHFLDDLESVHMFGQNTRGLTALEYANQRAGRR